MRKNKIGKNGIGPIYISMSKNRNTHYSSTGIKVHKNDWDVERQKVKGSHPNSVRANKVLRDKLSEIEGLALQYEDRKVSYSSKSLKTTFAGDYEDDFNKYAFNKNQERYQTSVEDKIKFGTFRRFKSVLAKLSEYCPKLPFSNINSDFLKKYMVHLKSIGNNDETINSNMRCIRAMINLAKKEGIVDEYFNPFRGIKLPSGKGTKAFLDADELGAIQRLKFASDSKLELHRDMFIFAAYAAGMRVADVLLLKKENYDGEYLIYHMKKNGKRMRIKLPTVAKEIIDRYVKSSLEESSFVFPMINISSAENNDRVIHTAVSRATALINKSLKIISALAEIEKHLSFHVARHSFGTLCLTKGLKLDTVRELMGHSDAETTKIYARLIDPVLDEAMDVFG